MKFQNQHVVDHVSNTLVFELFEEDELLSAEQSVPHVQRTTRGAPPVLARDAELERVVDVVDALSLGRHSDQTPSFLDTAAVHPGQVDNLELDEESHMGSGPATDAVQINLQPKLAASQAEEDGLAETVIAARDRMPAKSPVRLQAPDERRSSSTQ